MTPSDHDPIGPLQVIQTDDTTVPVLDAQLGRTRMGRLWVYLGDCSHPYALYVYSPDRCGIWPEQILGGYEGFLQADAYTGYDALYATGKIIEVGCMAHARRKFYEAKETDPQRAHVAMAYIRRLHNVEDDLKKLDDDQRMIQRLIRAGPILQEMRVWLEAQLGQILPKSPIAEAVGYALRNWKALTRYLDAGYLSIDNNAVERALRTVAVGRKNWLFVGSDAGGKTAAVWISLTSTCALLKIDPFAYLRDVLGRIVTHPKDRIEEFCCPTAGKRCERRRSSRPRSRGRDGLCRRDRVTTTRAWSRLGRSVGRSVGRNGSRRFRVAGCASRHVW